MNKDIMSSIEKNDVISFVGGGGKTTIMFNIAFAAANIGLNVLVSTTTKIFLPEKHFYEKIVLRETFSKFENGELTNITVFGGRVENKKIIASSEEELKKYIENEKFDLVLIEADGSRRKSLKAYKEHEPCVPFYSNKVFLISSLDAIGMTLDERYIYNSKRVAKILCKEEGQTISKEDILSLIKSEHGLFEKLEHKDRFVVLTKCVNKERRDNYNFISRKLKNYDKDIKVYMNY